MTMQTIDSKDVSLSELLHDFYVVPSYQREYVWQTEEVERLLQDIGSEYSPNDPDVDSEYFIGSIVVCQNQDGTFELIDGQQRMTTTFIALCAIRDYLDAVGATQIDELQHRIRASSVDDQGRDVFRYRIALQYDDSHDVLEGIGRGDDISAILPSTRSIENILNAYGVIRTHLRNEFQDDAAAVKQFYSYFTRRVKLIRVKTVSVAHALKVFETINDRGVGLDSMDLLKNLLFMHAERNQFDRLKDVWKDLVDILHDAKEKPLRFLRYFVFSTYEVERLREDQIYGWFVRNEARCGYRTDPIGFANGLLEAAKAYAHFIKGEDINGNPNRYLANILYLSGSARQHLILLLSGRRLPREQFDKLCREIENLFFAYIIAREPTRAFERDFALWAPHLRRINNGGDLQSFIDTRLRPAKELLAPRFALALETFGENSTLKYRMRYVLAKLTQHVNEQAWGNSRPSYSDLKTFINAKIHIEHILPQQPSEEVLNDFDELESIRHFTHMLGNLTLVEEPINLSVGNRPFVEKQKAYVQSELLLTRSLGKRVSVGVDTSVDRAVRNLLEFEEWTSKSIEDRQKMLARLAHQVWEMPIPSEEKT